jgi:hypothetical protein
MREQLTGLDVVNKTPTATRAAIVRALVERNSIRATARLAGTAKATILKLLVELGEFCSVYQNHALTKLPTKRVDLDEIWAFVGAKAKNATKATQGDIWTFTALDAGNKLMISWLVGRRMGDDARIFMADVASRLAHRVQITRRPQHVSRRGRIRVQVEPGRLRLDREGVRPAFGCCVSAQLQPRRLHWRAQGMGDGQPRHGSRVHVLRRAGEPHDPHGAAPIYAAHQCLFKEGRESRPLGFALLHALQLLPRPPDADQSERRNQDNASDGGWPDRPRLDGRGTHRTDGREPSATFKLTRHPPVRRAAVAEGMSHQRLAADLPTGAYRTLPGPALRSPHR